MDRLDAVYSIGGGDVLSVIHASSLSVHLLVDREGDQDSGFNIAWIPDALPCQSCVSTNLFTRALWGRVIPLLAISESSQRCCAISDE